MGLFVSTTNLDHIKYNKRVTNAEFRSKSTRAMRSFIKNSVTWELSDKDHASEKWNELFELIESISIKQFVLCWNQNKNILKEISHICYRELTFLTLTGNQITNIELLAVLDAPKLKELYLGANKIMEVKSLRKTCFEMIDKIGISKNPIRQITGFSELHTKYLGNLTIEEKEAHYVANQYDNEINQNRNWLIKIQSENLSLTKYQSEKRMLNRKVDGMIKERWGLISFEIQP